MNYVPRPITDMTIEQIDAELDQMAYDEWRYSKAIDRPRMWDLEAAKKQLLKKGEANHG